MKKYLILILISLVFFACEKRKDFIYTTDLAAMQSVTEKDPASGGFFLFFGAYQGETFEKKVTFAWRLNEEYIITTIDLEKVRLQFDEKVASPKVRLRFSSSVNKWSLENNLSNALYWDLKYITIICKRNLWNPVFELPMSKSVKKDD